MIKIKNKNGFTLIECIITTFVFSVGILAIASTTTVITRASQHSSRITQAIAMAEDLIADLRSRVFILNPDAFRNGEPGEEIDNRLINNIVNDSATTSSALFVNPDHAYAIDAQGIENADILLNYPNLSGTLSSAYLRRTWSIRDDFPVDGAKSINIVIGWTEGGQDHYLQIETIIAGDRYADTPGS